MAYLDDRLSEEEKGILYTISNYDKESDFIHILTSFNFTNLFNLGYVNFERNGLFPFFSEEYRLHTKKRLKNNTNIDSDGCWIWNKCLVTPKRLYGLTSLSINNCKKKYLSHRASYLVFNGVIPKGLHVLHYCDKPFCINPNCLHLGTGLINQKEMFERGRATKPTKENNGNSKFTQKIINEIRNKYEFGWTQRDLSRFYNTTSSNINCIVNNKTWKV